MRRVVTVLVLAAAAPAAARAQRVEVAPARVGALLTALAHDSMEGRDTGTRGAARAARLIAAELERAGLEPGGDSGFFQRVPLAWQTAQVRGQGGQARTVRRLVVLSNLAARDTLGADARTATQAVNVVGIIRGSDPALREEAVVLTAHYDHVGTTTGGRCAAIGADSVCNGADDDASGTVAVIEMARLLAGERPAPRRTVVAVLVTGEERGLLGTRWYLDYPAIPLERTMANLNLEMIARPDSLAGGSGKGWLTGWDRSSMGALLLEAGVPLVSDPRPEQGFFTRSDNIAFARRGIPAHTISSYNMHTDYHRASDEARFADAAHMAAVIEASARAARLLADGPAPQWAPGDSLGMIPRGRPSGARGHGGTGARGTGARSTGAQHQVAVLNSSFWSSGHPSESALRLCGCVSMPARPSDTPYFRRMRARRAWSARAYSRRTMPRESKPRS